MTVNVKLVYSESEFVCETCGWDYVNGLEVYVDGRLVAGEPARAYCTGGSEYPSLVDVIRGVLSELVSDFEIEEIKPNVT